MYRGRRGDRLYAVKVLDATRDRHASGDDHAFRREAELLAGVDHPGLARVHEVGVLAGRPYLVMDLLEGRRLAEVLADGQMPLDLLLRVAADVAAALGAAHRAGLVHRDVKPDNIVIGVHGLS